TVNDIGEGSVVTHRNTVSGETVTMTRAGDTATISVSEAVNPLTGRPAPTATTQATGEGIVRGDRDTGGFDKSGAGDNPRSSPQTESGSGGGGSDESGGRGDSRGNDCCDDNSSPGQNAK
ncbi:MAG: hypothetical protein LBT31_00655, partial [Synergistaceae bacterium]|nr:hypothetical protein [Synergistaceae bacterium]